MLQSRKSNLNQNNYVFKLLQSKLLYWLFPTRIPCRYFVSCCHDMCCGTSSVCHSSLTHLGVLEVRTHSHHGWRSRRWHRRGVWRRVEVSRDQHHVVADVVLQFVGEGQIEGQII